MNQCNLVVYSINKSTFGLVLIAKRNLKICALFLGNSKLKLVNLLEKTFFNIKEVSNKEEMIISYIEGKIDTLAVDLELNGTKFEKMVWEFLLTIPKGTVVSYKYVARQLGIENSYRAVARACSKNNIAFLIPCHRVIYSNNTISGYRFHQTIKKLLLKNELSLKQYKFITS